MYQVYLRQLSDFHDDHTLDCGVWVKGLHVRKTKNALNVLLV